MDFEASADHFDFGWHVLIEEVGSFFTGWSVYIDDFNCGIVDVYRRPDYT